MVVVSEKLKEFAVSTVSGQLDLGTLIGKGKEYFINNICMIWNLEDNIEYISKVGESYFQLEPNDWLGKNMEWTDIFDGDIVQSVRKHFLNCNDPLQLTDVTVFHSKASVPLFDVNITPMTLGEGHFYFAYFENKTTLDDLYDYLEENEKQMTTAWLAAGLVHEIRNPLTSLKGFLQLLQAGVNQKEEYYHVMINEVEKLEEMTNELLLMAKPHKSDKQIESVQQLIEDVVFIMRTQTDLRNINFELKIEDTLFIDCKANRIKQVLINLLKNSAEAMDYHGHITIDIYEKADKVYICVTDEGKGMEMDQLKEAGTPFYTTKENGTGLGLVIIKRILENHNGGYSFHKNDDQGVTVTVHLPSVKE